MLCVKTYEELCEQRIYNKRQFWYYVILLNPRDLSVAGKNLLGNLDYFHLASGENCVYFIPGFLNSEEGIFRQIFDYFKNAEIIRIKNYGKVQFFLKDFVECVHKLERNNGTGWRYSGECELLLFNLDKNGKIISNDFASYNLDDIVRNGRNLSSFIHETIAIGERAFDKILAKRQLDEIYAKFIMPPISNETKYHSESLWNSMLNHGFNEDDYYFISYSSKDYCFAKKVRDSIEAVGIKCWMAPRDIPSGTNYAHIIEIAIKNSQKFILLISKSSVWSVWVEKELQRAIHYFQHESSQKITAVWVENQFDLDSTPMAFSIEGIQILGCLNSVDDYKMLLPSEIQDKLKMKEKLETTLEYFENNMVTTKSLQDQFTKLLSIAIATKKHIKNTMDDNCKIQLNDLCNQLKRNIQSMNNLSETDDNFNDILHSSFEIEHKLKDFIGSISSLYS